MNDTQLTIELKLVESTHPILALPTQPWSEKTNIDAHSLVKEMLRIMYVTNGIGLSAPQVGIDAAMFVIGNESNSIACFNPRVISVNSEKIQMQEGCLTFPGLYLNITRPSEIEVEYEDIQQQTQTKKLQGIMARVFLHELDHLYGVCFVDRAAKLSVKLAQQRIKKNLKKQGNHEFIR